MTTDSDRRDPFRDWDAAYVLGALSPDDRRAFERHLSTCAACSSAVAEIAGIPGILGELPAGRAVALLAVGDGPGADVSDETVRHLASHARRLTRRRRLVAAGVLVPAATLLLFGGVLFGASVVAPGPNPGNLAQPSATAQPTPTAGAAPGTPVGQTLAMTPVDQAEMTATLNITPKAWGTRLDWTCSYGGEVWPRPSDGSGAAAGPTYVMVVTDTAGSESTVASWGGVGDKAGGLGASSSVQVRDIRSIDIRLAGADVPLVEAHP